MMMKTEFKFTNVERLECSLTATMTVAEWRRILAALVVRQPDAAQQCFASYIRDMLSKAETELWDISKGDVTE